MGDVGVQLCLLVHQQHRHRVPGAALGGRVPQILNVKTRTCAGTEFVAGDLVS